MTSDQDQDYLLMIGSWFGLILFFWKIRIQILKISSRIRILVYSCTIKEVVSLYAFFKRKKNRIILKKNTWIWFLNILCQLWCGCFTRTRNHVDNNCSFASAGGIDVNLGSSLWAFDNFSLLARHKCHSSFY